MIWKYVREQKPQPVNRRAHERHEVDAVRAEIDRNNTRVIDISRIGLRLNHSPTWMIEGQGVNLRLIFTTRWQDIRMPVEGRILRRSSDGTIVLYRPPIEDWPDSLMKLVSACRL